MKTLFVASDFSSASHNAFLYSLELARALPARIILFHAYQEMVIPNFETTITISQNELRNMAEDRLQQHVRAAGKAVQSPIEIKCVVGPVATELLTEADKVKADFIVTGMKGQGKAFRKLFGSTVTELIRHSDIPLLVIPEDSSYRPPVQIALADDLQTDTSSHTFDELLNLGQCFHAKVYMIRICKNIVEEVFEFQNRPARLNSLSKVLPTEYLHYEDKHVTDALIDFVEEQKIDLLTLVPHRHSFLEHLLQKSHTEAMAFKSKIPLLILPEKKTEHEPGAPKSSALPINEQGTLRS